VVVSARKVNDGVEVSVADDGPGIPAHVHGRIFDAFFTTKEVGKGTGLGLSIARRIIDSHHGEIDFETKPGGGTSFRVWLPIKQVRNIDADSKLLESTAEIDIRNVGTRATS
jgi:signal transduction histidine kinase